MNFKHGWLESCHAMISNHYHLPRQPQYQGGEKKLVVLHCISLPAGVYDNCRVERLFTYDLRRDDCDILQAIMKNSGRVSAHFYIKRSGERIQFVPVHYCAWHAGVSKHNAEENCNDFSIGIELQGKVGDEFTEHQYQSLVSIVLALQKKFYKINNIETEQTLSDRSIVGHSDISPLRKQDPGEGFDWDYFSDILKTTNR